MHRKSLASLLLAALGFTTAWAQTDVTSIYLTNPSFEADAAQCNSSTEVREGTEGLRGWNLSSITGWTTTSPGKQLLISADCATDNGFGKTAIADGTYAFYQRFGWGSATGSLSQTTTEALPAGKYQMTFRYKAFAANGAVSTCTPQVKGSTSLGSETYSFEAGSPNIMGSTGWSTGKVSFTVAAPEAVTFMFANSFGDGGSCIAIDDVRLVSIPDDYVEPTEPTEQDLASPTEGVITSDFVDESTMMKDLLQMLANHLTYMKSLYTPCASPNSKGEACGYFKDTEGTNNDEKVVRPNADFSMVCAFLYKYAQGKVTLPSGITWADVKDMALKSLIWGYSSHNANKFKVTSRQAYWGSISTSQYTWESSLWAMSLCYSAHFLMDELTAEQKTYIYNMVKAECNYELGRNIPTGYADDTKAEENGWEADILAAALGLFPNDELAPQWFDRLRAFAINSYSHPNDALNTNVLDDWYDKKTVADYYEGQNLYDDYTLQNHSLFHTSYQNVVMQELGEAHLAMLLFQGDNVQWKTNALMHNQQHVQDDVLNWLALTDGELAMPNGNDWSLFLFDQITSYSTMACFLRDKNALLLENLAYKFIKARQTTTSDGSWLLRSDAGSRRMGVEAHRVMMTYLMHLTHSTADLTPPTWEAFRAAHSEARVLPCQNVVRAFTRDRFTTFSWSNGLKSYTGYIAANSVDKNKIIVPFRANNTGNLIGWYTVSGKSTDATPVVSGIYKLKGDAYTMNGELNTNGSSLDNRFALYSTPGNAVIYLDEVRGLASGTITGEYGGLLAISVDELTKTSRTIYYHEGYKTLDGSSLRTFDTPWANIDNAVGVVSGSSTQMAFGDRANNNSILTAKLYPSYSNGSRTFTSGCSIDRRNIVYYSNINAETTAAMHSHLQVLTSAVPAGWNGVIAADPDGTHYLLIANFNGTGTTATLTDITCPLGAPVFTVATTIQGSSATATFTLTTNNNEGEALKIFVKGSAVTAQQDPESDEAAFLTATANGTVEVSILSDGTPYTASLNLAQGQTVRVYVEGGILKSEASTLPVSEANYIVNPSFDGNSTAGWSGTSMTADYNEVEKYNANFDFKQELTGLPAGEYILSCQGFYRNGSYENASATHAAGTEAIHAQLYATSSVESKSQPLPSIIDEAGKKGPVGVNVSQGYIPNSMEEAATYLRAGLYPAGLKVKVGSDGLLTIGVKKSTLVDKDWTLFDNFQLTPFVLGDVNRDSKTTIADVTALVNLILGQLSPSLIISLIADLNDDGFTSIADVTALVNHILAH